MWELDYSGQVYTLILSLFTGSAFCLVFDFYTALRVRLNLNKATVFIFDILIFIAFGLFDFCFFLSQTGGEVRGYVLTGQVIGFILCKKSISKVFGFALALLFKIIKSVLKLSKKLILNPLISAYLKICEFFHILAQKYSFFHKKRLKKPKDVVYTKENYTQSEKRKEA